MVESNGVREPAVAVDVAVVGAGISGLRVARTLQDRDVSVVVVEARNRVGGRLLSPHLADGAGRVDLGATWFWPGEHRVAQLVTDLGLATHDQHVVGDAVYQAPDGPRRLDGNPLDVPAHRFTDGAQSLAEGLVRTLAAGTVQTGTAVRRVAGTGPFVVDHDHGAVETRHVVIALPPALAQASIRFDPPLPDRQAGLASSTPVWMGATTKVVIRYPDALWRRQNLAGSAISHLGPLREIHDMSGPGGDPAVLFGFASADGPGGPVEESRVVAQLCEIFGPDAAEAVEVLMVDWREEAETSPGGVERLAAYQTFGHPEYRSQPGTFLHWSSTETAGVAAGHIEGALEAADRTTAAILADLGLAAGPNGDTTWPT